MISLAASSAKNHPRVGGEKAGGHRTSPFHTESPPRGRGKERQDHEAGSADGITPAWAGKSLFLVPWLSYHQNHPRVGGEKCSCNFVFTFVHESPPRGRGKVEDMRKAGLNPRITPAWAGKRERREARENRAKNHPRVGGEKSLAFLPSISYIESPPRGRGKGKLPPPALNGTGITPAWAGKSYNTLGAIQQGMNHPRVGGEKPADSRPKPTRRESPPRGRGKAALWLPCRVCRGITPAWAGKRKQGNQGWPAGKNHPRVGGEKTKKIP